MRLASDGRRMDRLYAPRTIAFLFLVGLPFSICTQLLADGQQPKPTIVYHVNHGGVVPSPKGAFGAKSIRGAPPEFFEFRTGRVTAHCQPVPVANLGNFSFSPDGKLLCGFSVDTNRPQWMAIWETDSGKLVARPLMRADAGYILSHRFSANGRSIYLGGRNRLYRYDLASGLIVTLSDDVIYYVTDICDTPDGDYVAYLEGLPRKSDFDVRLCPRDSSKAPIMRLSSLSLGNPSFLPTCIDIDSSGAEMAISARTRSVPNITEFYSIFRVDLRTGRLVQKAVSLHHIHAVRYIGRTSTLAVYGEVHQRSLRNFFGFHEAGSDVIVGQHEVDSMINSMAVMPGDSGYIAVSTTGDSGNLLYWDAKDWSIDWVNVLRLRP